MSRLGRTRPQKALLFALGTLLAFLIGRWSGDDVADGRAREADGMPASVSGVPLVLDGDSLDFNGIRVRLFGIDAFERDQVCGREDGSRFDCGQSAREALLFAVGGAMVRCAKRDVDQYGRMVAVCHGREGDLAARLVEDGQAVAYRQFSHDYVDEEEVARQRGRGAWAGRFDSPWDWRRSRAAGGPR